MRILHILDHSLPLQSGYVFRSMEILREQRAIGWETIQLTTPKHPLPTTPVETIEDWEFHRTPIPTGLLSKVPVADQLAVIDETARQLKKLVLECRPDILHAHSPVLNAISALRIGRRFGFPVVYEVRGFWEDAATEHGTAKVAGPKYQATRYLETKALGRAQAITTISEALRQAIIQRGIAPGKVTVIPNAVDSKRFSATRCWDSNLANRLGTAGMTILGYIGSFYSYEGLDLLLKVLPGVLATKPKSKVLLVGGGPDEVRLKAMTDALDIASHVVFTGWVPQAEIHDYYRLIDVLVYPRKSGRLTELVTPLKPLEAMAQERIVLASDVGGHRELIEDGKTGYLFRTDDPDDLVRRLLDILENPGDWPRIRASGRSFVEKERTWHAAVARYRGVYSRVLESTW